MIADLKPFAEYKESGLPWLGQVPGHWDTRRLRHACDMRVSNVDKHTKVGETQVRLCNYVEVYKNERIRESTRFMAATASEDERVRFGLRKGDVLITKDSEQWNDIGVPALVEFEAPDLVCGYHLAILRARPGLHGAFLHRALESHFIAAQFHVEANGVTRYGLSHGAIQGVAIPLPPPAEQAAIVRFLDWANGRLERAIRAKRKVIALLNEQKQAIIHRAVTRGLDPSVPLKPSGIPWLGDIPQHWEVRRLRASITDCVNGLWGSDPDGENDLTCVRVADFDRKNLRVTLKKKTTRSIPVSARGRRLLQPGDLLLEKSGGGERQPVGAVVLYDCDEPAVCSNFVARLPVAAGYHSGFMSYLHSALYALRMTVPSIKQTTGIQNLDGKSYLAERVAFPDRTEQTEISSDLDNENARFSQAISRLEREIELLREYRTRLVADVVTGKLDVREAAARLPDEAAPDTVEDDTDLSLDPEAADEEAAV